MCNTLTSLSLNHVFIQNKSDVPWHQLKALSVNMPAKDIDDALLHSISQSVNLTSLHIIGMYNQHMIDNINVKELKHLESFQLLIGGAAPFGSVRNLLPQLNKDTLTSLHVTVWHDHEDCFAEVSKMTNLKRLNLHVRHPTLHYEPVDMSALVQMTQLTSLSLNAGNCKGLDNVTNMTNLSSLKIALDNANCPLDSVSLSSLIHLRQLSLSLAVKDVDIRGTTRLEELHFNCSINYDINDLQHLNQISINRPAAPIPWTDLAQCTLLENILTDSIDTNGSVLALENLKRLTRLGNANLFARSCVHFDPNHIAQLTRLQHVEVTVPTTGVTKQILEEKLPMLLHFKERQCVPCLQQRALPESEAKAPVDQ